MNQPSEHPKVDRVKLNTTTDQTIQCVDRYQSTIPECLVKEILISTGFQSQDLNAYKLIGILVTQYKAHITDKWLSEISESIISKKYGADRRKRDPENKPQISTDEVVNDLEQRGVRLLNPFVYPTTDPELLNTNLIPQLLNKQQE